MLIFKIPNKTLTFCNIKIEIKEAILLRPFTNKREFLPSCIIE